MGVFFTVDRVGTLTKGMVIDLTRYTDIKPPELQQHVDYLFQNGVSTHGERYLLRSNQSLGVASPTIEILFEYVRRAEFPDQLSRFQAVFACPAIDEARRFREAFGEGDHGIWKVRAERSLQADMGWMSGTSSILGWTYAAHQYWTGQASLGPLWECLLEPPVRVTDRVE